MLGGKHLASRCHFKTEKCHACGKVGHIAKMCRTKKREQQMHTVQEATLLEEYTLYPVVQQQASSTPLQSTVMVDGKELSVEVDTGASLSLISEMTYKKLWKSDALPELQQTAVKLRTYTGEEIGVLGCINVEVQSKEQGARSSAAALGGERQGTQPTGPYLAHQTSVELARNLLDTNESFPRESPQAA